MSSSTSLRFGIKLYFTLSSYPVVIYYTSSSFLWWLPQLQSPSSFIQLHFYFLYILRDYLFCNIPFYVSTSGTHSRPDQIASRSKSAPPLNTTHSLLMSPTSPYFPALSVVFKFHACCHLLSPNMNNRDCGKKTGTAAQEVFSLLFCKPRSSFCLLFTQL